MKQKERLDEKVKQERTEPDHHRKIIISLSNLDVEHLPWIEDFKSYQNLTSLNRRVLVELVESITVYDKEHIHIQESKKVCYYICRARQADDKCIGHQITEKLLKALVMDQLHLFIVRLSDKRKVLEELRKIEDMQNPVYRAKSEIMSLTDKVGQMAKKREQLYADYVAGVVDFGTGSSNDSASMVHIRR